MALEYDALPRQIIGAAIETHRRVGPDISTNAMLAPQCHRCLMLFLPSWLPHYARAPLKLKRCDRSERAPGLDNACESLQTRRQSPLQRRETSRPRGRNHS
jgi:hypothetical protein